MLPQPRFNLEHDPEIQAEVDRILDALRFDERFYRNVQLFKMVGYKGWHKVLCDGKKMPCVRFETSE